MESNSNLGVAILYLVVWAGVTAWSYNIGKKKGRGTAGLVLGLLLGIIGVVITSCLRPERHLIQPTDHHGFLYIDVEGHDINPGSGGDS